MTLLPILRSFPARAASLALAIGITATSCTENNTQPPKSDLNLKALLPDDIQGTQPTGGAVVMSSTPGVLNGGQTVTGPLAPTTPTQTAAVTPPPPNAIPQATVVKEDAVIPKNAKWTISCAVVGGPGHVERAKQLKQRLAATGSNKWYLVHEDDKSALYYGFYTTLERGTPEGEAAQRDRQDIAKLHNAAGETPLALCSFIMIDRPAPQAPAEWDLATYSRYPRDPQHYWSLQIAAYTADAKSEDGDATHDRKWAAIESVKALRAQGIPAYYYNGDAVSSVCVGLWPETAVRQQSGGNDRGNAGSINADTPLFVSNAPLPADMTPKAANGMKVKTMSPKVEIIDRSMYDLINRFPTHMTNNEEMLHKVKNAKTGQVEQMPAPSFLVLVPESRQVLTQSGRGNTPVDSGQLPQLPPSILGTDSRLPRQPGVGRLREVGQ